MQNDSYLSIGSNMGNRSANCREALKALDEIDEVKVLSFSSLYETKPVGYEKQPDFINMAVKIKTALPPQELLLQLKNIEKLIGRENSFRWGPRIIDLDILLYADKIVTTPTLNIPHPRMTERAFVLIPLLEIGAEVRHPLSGKTVAQLSAGFSKNSIIRLKADKK